MKNRHKRRTRNEIEIETALNDLSILLSIIDDMAHNAALEEKEKFLATARKLAAQSSQLWGIIDVLRSAIRTQRRQVMSNLPDGCKQSDIDRAMGAMPDALERQIDDQVADLQAVRKILTEYQAKAAEYREPLRKLTRLYEEAAWKIRDIHTKSSYLVQGVLDERLGFFDDLPIDDFSPDAPFREALDALPSDDDLSEQIQWDWEENHGQ